MSELPAAGPNPQRVRFYKELAAAMEFLALWHSLPADAQRTLNSALSAAAAETYKQPSN